MELQLDGATRDSVASPVSAGAVPHLSLLLGRTRPLPAPLAGDTLSFWYNARVAIYQGVRRIGLGSGDRVLAPAYACGSELDALLRAGLTLDLYRHHPDLSPDLDHLAELCTDTTRLLYVTHYFGFPQPMAALLDFARQRRLLVVEDCAHALYSAYPDGAPIGTAGDAAVFSLTKSTPLPDGGALLLNRPTAEGARPCCATPPAWLAVAGKSRYLVEEAAARRMPRLTRAVKERVNDPLVRWLKARGGSPTAAVIDDTPGPMEILQLAPERVAWGMSSLARHMLRRLPHAAILDRRRRNFCHLAERLQGRQGYRPLFPSLPDHCCPLTFPLLVEDPISFHDYCLARGVATTRTWTYFHTALPMDRFPAESHLKRHVVSVPIHQDLGEPEMERITALVGNWAG